MHPMPKRVLVRIELTPQAKDRVEQVSDRRGMTQFAMLSRLVEWFSHLDVKVQPLVMGHYPKEIEAEVAKMLLKGAV